MPVPDFQSLMLPLLKLLSDSQEHAMPEIVDKLALQFSLSRADIEELLPSGKQRRFANRAGWAKSYLVHCGLAVSPRRNHIQIADRGRTVLAEKPGHIDLKYLSRFPEYRAFRSGNHIQREDSTIVIQSRTPREILEDAFQEMRLDLAAQVLETLLKASPSEFERIVVDVLVKMGYGGSHKEAAKAVGKSGDGGIDGIIDEDRLGLDNIYIQAKRWDGVVGRPEIQKFVGALMGRKGRKGIFITTSSFSSEAKDFAGGIDYKIVLVDGKRLAELMIDHGVGVSTESSIEIKRLDSDYFSNA